MDPRVKPEDDMAGLEDDLAGLEDDLAGLEDALGTPGVACISSAAVGRRLRQRSLRAPCR